MDNLFLFDCIQNERRQKYKIVQCDVNKNGLLENYSFSQDDYFFYHPSI